MKHYIVVLRFTEQGAKTIDKSTKRAHEIAALAEKTGVTIHGQFWTTGSFDGILIVAAFDEQKALHLISEIAAAGNMRTETLRAFTAEEFDAILAQH